MDTNKCNLLILEGQFYYIYSWADFKGVKLTSDVARTTVAVTSERRTGGLQTALTTS